MRLRALSVLSLAAVHSLHSQAELPRLSWSRELSVDATASKLPLVRTQMGIRSDGSLVVADVDGRSLAFVDRTMHSIRMVPRPPGTAWTFTTVTGMGWVGDTLYLVDRPQGTISYFGGHDSVASIRAIQRNVPGPASSAVVRHDAPNDAPQVIAAYPGGLTLLLPRAYPPGIPARPHFLPLILVDAVGKFIAYPGELRVDSEECTVRNRALRSLTVKPFCAQGNTGVSPDGHSIIQAEAGIAGPDSGYIVVTRTTERGDTVYRQRIAFQPMAVTSTELDSIARAGGSTDPLRRAAFRQALDGLQLVIHQPIVNLLAGNDGTVWLEEPSTTSDRQWLIIDGKGKPAGRLALPAGVHLLEVHRDGALGLELVSAKQFNLVRFGIGK